MPSIRDAPVRPGEGHIADPARRLEGRAALALTLVGILAITNAVLFVRAQRTTANDAPVITIAGRQRMLTQKFANLALEIQVAAERGQFAFLTGELRSALEVWAGAHEALQHGDRDLGLPAADSPELAAEFEQIRPDYEAIRAAGERLLGATTATSPENAYDRISRDVLEVLNHADPFSEGMDRIAALYLSEAQARAQQTQHLVWLLTGVIAFVLLLEGVFIFRPAAKMIRRGFRTQQKLAEEARKLALVASRTDNGVIITDARGRTEWVNDAFVRMTGWNLEDLQGQVPHVLIECADIDAGTLAELRDALVAGETIRSEIRHRRKDGGTYWGDIEGVPVTDATGAVIQFIGIERDVTERKHAEAEIRRYTSEVEASRDRLSQQAERLEQMAGELALARDEAVASARAKSEFLANMSHEIRTPMNGVIGMTALLLDTDLTEEQRDYALTVGHSADALLTVINDILDFSKIEAGKLTLEKVDFSLRTVLEEVGDLLAPRAHEKGLEFACILPPDAPDALRGDPARLRQMVINLVGNAIKFTEAGEVSVEAQVLAQTATQATIRVSVRDTGIGIPPERHAAVFESFTQADGSTTRRYGGTGLGLTISRQLVELMGGRIGLESAPGQGSTFWLELPFERSAETVGVRKPPASLAGRRVLVVDDHVTNRRSLHGQLRSWGMRSVEVASGQEALSVLRSEVADDPFAVVLLDLQMPGMDGDATAAAIKSDPRLAPTPLVLLSSGGLRSVEEAHSRGFAAALAKPARATRLFRTLMEVLGAEAEAGPEAPARVGASRASKAAALGLRVLLVEDNPVNQLVARRLLEKWGCHVDCAADGREALAAWERAAYAAVLMDVQMPVMDGYEATAELRRREAGTGRHTPVIAMTAHAMAGDERRCLELGMDDYVAKPVKPDLLHDKLARLVSPEAPSVAAPAVPTADVVCDAERLEELCGSDLGFRRELLSDFLELAPQMLARIDASIIGGDQRGLAVASQSLKASARTLGAAALGGVCQELEHLGGQGGTLDEARDALERARREFARLRVALRAYLPDPLR